MEPRIKAALAHKKMMKEAAMLDPLRISIRGEVHDSNGERYYVSTCLGRIAQQHREAFKNGQRVPYSTQADGTARTIQML